MTAMDVTYSFEGPLDERQIQALAGHSDVYGIRKLSIDEDASTLAIEYDATRMNEARVAALVRACTVRLRPALAAV